MIPIKQLYGLTILPLAFFTLIAAATPELLIKECTLINKLMTSLSPAEQEQLEITIKNIAEESHSPEEVYEKIHALRESLINQQVRFIGHPDMQPYPTYMPNYGLDKVWLALIYCGIGCAIFLGITTVQDAHARKLLDANKKELKNCLAADQKIKEAVCAIQAMMREFDTIKRYQEGI